MKYKFVTRFTVHPAPMPGYRAAHPRTFAVDEIVNRTHAVGDAKAAIVYFTAEDGREFMADLGEFEAAAQPI